MCNCPPDCGVNDCPVRVVTEIKSDPVCSDGSDPNVPEPLEVCNVYVHLDPPATELVAVGFADITTSDPNGFYQNPFNATDVSPQCFLIPIFPSLVCDSFVTVGTKCYDAAQNAATSCFFDTVAFNFGGQVAGDWLNIDPTGPWGLPDANGNVLVAQLAARAGHSIGGIFRAYVKGPFGGAGPCPDLDGDGFVGASDLALVLGNCGPCPGCAADFNGDGVVNAFDIGYVLAHFGPCGTPVDFGEFDLSFDCFESGQFRWEKDTLCSELVPPCEEHTGACCDEGNTGECIDGVPESECQFERWEKDVFCDELDPPCEEGGFCNPQCPTDILEFGGSGFNQEIDPWELANLLGCWSVPGPPGPCPPLVGVCTCFDFNGDGCISPIDLAGSVLGEWGACCTDNRCIEGESCDDCGQSDSGFPNECTSETWCADAVDNDCDGLIDCDDPDCTGDANCP